jgi:hypothetical protein
VPNVGAVDFLFGVVNIFKSGGRNFSPMTLGHHRFIRLLFNKLISQNSGHFYKLILFILKFMDSFNSPSTKPLYRGTQIVWYIFAVVEVLLAFRFLLKLLGANPAAGFSHFIYGVTYIFASPFLSVFRITQVAGSVFEWTTLLAMLVYWVVAVGIIKLFLVGKTVSTPEAAVKLNAQENN